MGGEQKLGFLSWILDYEENKMIFKDEHCFYDFRQRRKKLTRGCK